MSDTQEMRDAIVAGQARFMAALDGLDAATLELEPAVGIWPARTVAGHVADWVDELAASGEHALGGPAPAGQPIEDGEEFNMTRAARHEGTSWAQSAGRLESSVKRVLALLERATPEQLDRPATYPWDEQGTLRSLLQVVPDHHIEHAEHLEAWRERRGDG